MPRYCRPIGTIWRRALRRVDRRAAQAIACPCEHCDQLLAEAVRIANRLFS